MPRLLVATRKRVIILQCQGFSVRDIQCRLEEEGVEVSLRSLQATRGSKRSQTDCDRILSLICQLDSKE